MKMSNLLAVSLTCVCLVSASGAYAKENQDDPKKKFVFRLLPVEKVCLAEIPDTIPITFKPKTPTPPKCPQQMVVNAQACLTSGGTIVVYGSGVACRTRGLGPASPLHDEAALGVPTKPVKPTGPIISPTNPAPPPLDAMAAPTAAPQPSVPVTTPKSTAMKAPGGGKADLAVFRPK